MSTLDLDRWADLLIQRYGGPDVVGSALFPFTLAHVIDVDLGTLLVPLDRHPADYLRRYRVPGDCVALGMVSAGWAAPIDSPVRPSAHPEARRIVQATVMDRAGTLVGRIRMPDGSVVNVGEGGYGRVVDAMRLALRRRAA